MKKTLRNLKRALLMLLTAAATDASAQYDKLQFEPEKADAGAKIKLHYNSAGTPLENQKDVSCVLYYFSNQSFGWKGADVKLTPAGENKWTGEYASTADCAFITLKFTAGDSVDNNKNDSYGYLMSDGEHEGLNAPASRAAWGLLRSPGYGYTIDGYLDGSRSINDTVTHYWLDMELRQPFTNGKSAFAIPYTQSLLKAYGAEGEEKLSRVVGYLTRADAPMEDLVRAWYITGKLAKDSAAAAKIAQRVQDLQPNNQIAKLAGYRAFMQSRRGDEQEKLATDFLQKFPYDERFAWFDQLNNIEYTRVQLTAVLSKIGKDDFTAIDKYLDQMTFVTTITVYYKTIEVSHSRGTISDSFLYAYSTRLMKHMEDLRNNQPAEYGYMSPREWNAKVDEALYAGMGGRMYATHAAICNNTGRYEEALRYAEKAQSAQQFKLAELNDIHVKALQKTGRIKEMHAALEKGIYENEASVYMLGLLKEKYKKDRGSEAGFDQYLQAMKKKAEGEENHAADMIKVPMPDFAMKDANGKTVTLQSLKGKVVVLDFWAQWCVPCKASFPGMQLAVDRYKNDPDVIFYFVDTEEDKNSNYKAANIKYLKDHNFNFNLLFDNLKKDGKKTGEVFERICRKFTISGIPQKVLLDKEGNVRFIAVGFKGSATQLSDELSELIEITKKL